MAIATRRSCPVIGFAAISGTGKTTLLLKLIPLLNGRGLRVGLIKRAHHTFDTDKPGKDSYELRKAGASRVLVGSDRRWALVVENDVPKPPRLTDMLRNLQSEGLDLILVEGFKTAPIPKIEIHRSGLGCALMAPADLNIVAVATDARDIAPIRVPMLNLNRPEEIAEFIVGRFVEPRAVARDVESPRASMHRHCEAVAPGER